MVQEKLLVYFQIFRGVIYSSYSAFHQFEKWEMDISTKFCHKMLFLINRKTLRVSSVFLLSCSHKRAACRLTIGILFKIISHSKRTIE